MSDFPDKQSLTVDILNDLESEKEDLGLEGKEVEKPSLEVPIDVQ